MKTINIKKSAFIFLITAGLFSFSFTTKANCDNPLITLTAEIEEQELTIEPWMTSNECFEQLKSKLNNEFYECVLFEENEDELPIEGWMTDISFTIPNEIITKSFDTFSNLNILNKLL